MGRAFEAIRRRPIEALFAYFGLEVEPRLLAEHRAAISARFAAEVQELLRLCTGLRERERFTIAREALRLAYEGTVRRSAVA